MERIDSKQGLPDDFIRLDVTDKIIITSDGGLDYGSVEPILKAPKLNHGRIFDKAGVAHIGIYMDPAGE